MPQTAPRDVWPYGAFVALAMILVALGPHLYFFYQRGGEWNGSFPQLGDESPYASYLAALVDGRPRRSEPYTGRDDAPGESRPESMLSIQFLPPELLASVTRLLGTPSQLIFFALTPLAALASALALFYLLKAVLADERAAAAGALFALCVGSAHLGVEAALLGETFLNHLSFLRRYIPAVPFPILFIFFGLVWRALGGGRRRALPSALGASACFAALVYSYYFLWTAALAWLFCLTLLWLLVRRGSGREGLEALALIWALAVAALVPYFVLLSRRATGLDEAQIIVRTHSPDLFRVPELLGLLVIIALTWAARSSRVVPGERAVLFVASLALTPFVVFNQQVLTGRSAQPNHYEMFGVGHATMAAVMMAAVLVWRGRGRERKAPAPALALIALVALIAGAYQSLLAGRVNWHGNLRRDEARPAMLRLSAAGRVAGRLDTRSRVFATDPTVANALPTLAPQPVLWSPYMLFASDMSTAEDKERMSLYLYLAGVSFDDVEPGRFQSLDRFRSYFISSLIERARPNRFIRVGWTPITPEEIEGALRGYSEFVSTLDRALVEKYPLSYVLTSPREGVDFTNFDRWYERDAGENVGDFIIYRVRLRRTD